MPKNDKLSKEEIEHISKLALIDLTEEEKEKLQNELGEILNYFNKLNDLDTTNVKPLIHPIEGLKNVFREDIPTKSLTQQEVLKNATHTKEGFFKASKIIKD